MSWLLKTFLGLSTDASAANLNQLRDNLIALRNHTHSGESGGGDLLFGGAQFVQILPWFPTADVNWATLTHDGNYGCAILTTDTSALNNECSFPVALQRGTWNIDVIGRTTNSSGVVSVYLDDTLIGTLDFYSLGSDENVTLSITGFTVPALNIAAGQTLKFKVTSKNASSSSYDCGLRFIQLRRTGA